MSLEDLRARYGAAIRAAAQECGARSVRIYGSVARGEDRQESDIDFLVEFEEGRTLFDLVELTQRLRELTGREVDVATPRALRASLRDRILAEAVAL